MREKRAITFLVTFLIACPLVSLALTADELKTQLEEMVGRLTAMKEELQRAQGNTVSSTPAPVLPCLSLGRTLQTGVRGEDVSKLQEFLIAGGYLAKGNVTGYFGVLTGAAVRKWQSERGVVSSGDAASTGFGIVGPKTRAAILASCTPRSSHANSSPSACSAEPPAPVSICTGSWQKAYNTAGCVVGYSCTTDTSAGAVAVSGVSPSITVLTPYAGTVATGGNTLIISWRSSNASPSATVSLSLLNAAGESAGELVRGLAPSGVFVWRVPEGSTECAPNETAFACIERLARCEGSASVCSIQPGTYLVRATLGGTRSTTSAPFQVAGTGITDLLQTFVGAPVVPPPTFSTSSAPTVSGSACTYEGQGYAEGTTLSVLCAAGNCPSSGTGYITGACTSGLWCIPYTSYCAKVLTAIDVSAYEGLNAAPIGTGYSVSCPQEGWRAYLSCPYGGCTTGWNICRGGAWVLDTVQQTVIVGMQGPCESGQVWCGIGTGFGCVPQLQCVNGTAF